MHKLLIICLSVGKDECGLYAASCRGLNAIVEALVRAGGRIEGPETVRE